MPPDDSTQGSTTAAPLRIAIAADAPVVMAGVASMVRDAGPDVTMVDLPSGSLGLTAIDVVLYDPLNGVPAGCGPSGVRPGPALVAFSWSVRADTAMKARAQGAAGLLSKDLPADQLVAALKAIRAGDRMPYTVVVDDGGPARRRSRRPDGLTARELEMLEMITRGLSNEEIASSLYLSINSVKTYIRTAYRKIGVTRRPQAVLWGVHHGFGDDPPNGLSG
ncbi:response regulator transcription factor [Nocardioides sp.]|uniref:response regulator transcription factor n=1 Tax=Nocardioides sp. TaxID=35761 RepID=UPI0027176B9C|nr:response regulator transcription factor [Nocardioides sp.]MDO9457683.1 response regulator transcription factor [Nocardioides sp.]